MPDAQPARPPVNSEEPQTPPPHAQCWVRIAGTWHRGLIQYWIKLASGSWEVMITADELPVGPPWQGRYVYDPATIRVRDGDVLPTY